MMYVRINGSRAVRQFKEEMGHANQCLITILLGLGEIKRQGVGFKKPDSFSTTWAPQNIDATCDRSRAYAIKSSLSWTIDCLDMYFTLCLRKVSIISDVALHNKLSGAGQSVNAKFVAFFDALSDKDDTIGQYGAVVALAIQWRNNTMHYFATNKIDETYVKILESNKQWYLDNCCGLNIDETYERFKTGVTPTFKDMASIIRCVQKFVYKVDDVLLAIMDKTAYIQDIVREYYENKNTKPLACLVPTYTIERQGKKLMNIVLPYYITPADNGIELTDDMIKRFFRTIIDENRSQKKRR